MTLEVNGGKEPGLQVMNDAPSLQKLNQGYLGRTDLAKDSLLELQAECRIKNSKKIAEILFREIKTASVKKRKSQTFVKDIYKKLLFLHEFHQEIKEKKKRFPFSNILVKLVVEYIQLEHNALYSAEGNHLEFEKEVENRVINLLENMFLLYDKKPAPARCVYPNSLFVLKVLYAVSSEYRCDNNVFGNLVRKLLKKLKLWDAVQRSTMGICNITTSNPAVRMLSLYDINEIPEEYDTDDEEAQTINCELSRLSLLTPTEKCTATPSNKPDYTSLEEKSSQDASIRSADTVVNSAIDTICLDDSDEDAVLLEHNDYKSAKTCNSDLNKSVKSDVQINVKSSVKLEAMQSTKTKPSDYLSKARGNKVKNRCSKGLVKDCRKTTSRQFDLMDLPPSTSQCSNITLKNGTVVKIKSEHQIQIVIEEDEDSILNKYADEEPKIDTVPIPPEPPQIARSNTKRSRARQTKKPVVSDNQVNEISSSQIFDIDNNCESVSRDLDFSLHSVEITSTSTTYPSYQKHENSSSSIRISKAFLTPDCNSIDQVYTSSHDRYYNNADSCLTPSYVTSNYEEKDNNVENVIPNLKDVERNDNFVSDSHTDTFQAKICDVNKEVGEVLVENRLDSLLKIPSELEDLSPNDDSQIIIIDLLNTMIRMVENDTLDNLKASGDPMITEPYFVCNTSNHQTSNVDNSEKRHTANNLAETDNFEHISSNLSSEKDNSEVIHKDRVVDDIDNQLESCLSSLNKPDNINIKNTEEKDIDQNEGDVLFGDINEKTADNEQEVLENILKDTNNKLANVKTNEAVTEISKENCDTQIELNNSLDKGELKHTKSNEGVVKLPTMENPSFEIYAGEEDIDNENNTKYLCQPSHNINDQNHEMQLETIVDDVQKEGDEKINEIEIQDTEKANSINLLATKNVENLTHETFTPTVDNRISPSILPMDVPIHIEGKDYLAKNIEKQDHKTQKTLSDLQDKIDEDDSDTCSETSESSVLTNEKLVIHEESNDDLDLENSNEEISESALLPSNDIHKVALKEDVNIDQEDAIKNEKLLEDKPITELFKNNSSTTNSLIEEHINSVANFVYYHSNKEYQNTSSDLSKTDKPPQSLKTSDLSIDNKVTTTIEEAKSELEELYNSNAHKHSCSITYSIPNSDGDLERPVEIRIEELPEKEIFPHHELTSLPESPKVSRSDVLHENRLSVLAELADKCQHLPVTPESKKNKKLNLNKRARSRLIIPNAKFQRKRKDNPVIDEDSIENDLSYTADEKSSIIEKDLKGKKSINHLKNTKNQRLKCINPKKENNLKNRKVDEEVVTVGRCTRSKSMLLFNEPLPFNGRSVKNKSKHVDVSEVKSKRKANKSKVNKNLSENLNENKTSTDYSIENLLNIPYTIRNGLTIARIDVPTPPDDVPLNLSKKVMLNPEVSIEIIGDKSEKICDRNSQETTMPLKTTKSSKSKRKDNQINQKNIEDINQQETVNNEDEIQGKNKPQNNKEKSLLSSVSNKDKIGQDKVKIWQPFEDLMNKNAENSSSASNNKHHNEINSTKNEEKEPVFNLNEVGKINTKRRKSTREKKEKKSNNLNLQDLKHIGEEDLLDRYLNEQKPISYCNDEETQWFPEKRLTRKNGRTKDTVEDLIEKKINKKNKKFDVQSQKNIERELDDPSINEENNISKKPTRRNKKTNSILTSVVEKQRCDIVTNGDVNGPFNLHDMENEAQAKELFLKNYDLMEKIPRLNKRPSRKRGKESYKTDIVACEIVEETLSKSRSTRQNTRLRNKETKVKLKNKKTSSSERTLNVLNETEPELNVDSKLQDLESDPTATCKTQINQETVLTKESVSSESLLDKGAIESIPNSIGETKEIESCSKSDETEKIGTEKDLNTNICRVDVEVALVVESLKESIELQEEQPKIDKVVSEELIKRVQHASEEMIHSDYDHVEELEIDAQFYNANEIYIEDEITNVIEAVIDPPMVAEDQHQIVEEQVNGLIDTPILEEEVNKVEVTIKNDLVIDSSENQAEILSEYDKNFEEGERNSSSEKDNFVSCEEAEDSIHDLSVNEKDNENEEIEVTDSTSQEKSSFLEESVISLPNTSLDLQNFTQVSAEENNFSNSDVQKANSEIINALAQESEPESSYNEKVLTESIESTQETLSASVVENSENNAESNVLKRKRLISELDAEEQDEESREKATPMSYDHIIENLPEDISCLFKRKPVVKIRNISNMEAFRTQYINSLRKPTLNTTKRRIKPCRSKGLDAIVVKLATSLKKNDLWQINKQKKIQLDELFPISNVSNDNTIKEDAEKQSPQFNDVTEETKEQEHSNNHGLDNMPCQQIHEEITNTQQIQSNEEVHDEIVLENLDCVIPAVEMLEKQETNEIIKDQNISSDLTTVLSTQMQQSENMNVPQMSDSEAQLIQEKIDQSETELCREEGSGDGSNIEVDEMKSNHEDEEMAVEEIRPSVENKDLVEVLHESHSGVEVVNSSVISEENVQKPNDAVIGDIFEDKQQETEDNEIDMICPDDDKMERDKIDEENKQIIADIPVEQIGTSEVVNNEADLELQTSVVEEPMVQEHTESNSPDNHNQQDKNLDFEYSISQQNEQIIETSQKIETPLQDTSEEIFPTNNFMEETQPTETSYHEGIKENDNDNIPVEFEMLTETHCDKKENHIEKEKLQEKVNEAATESFVNDNSISHLPKPQITEAFDCDAVVECSKDGQFEVDISLEPIHSSENLNIDTMSKNIENVNETETPLTSGLIVADSRESTSSIPLPTIQDEPKYDNEYKEILQNSEINVPNNTSQISHIEPKTLVRFPTAMNEDDFVITSNNSFINDCTLKVRPAKELLEKYKFMQDESYDTSSSDYDLQTSPNYPVFNEINANKIEPRVDENNQLIAASTENSQSCVIEPTVTIAEDGSYVHHNEKYEDTNSNKQYVAENISDEIFTNPEIIEGIHHEKITSSETINKSEVITNSESISNHETIPKIVSSPNIVPTPDLIIPVQTIHEFNNSNMLTTNLPQFNTQFPQKMHQSTILDYNTQPISNSILNVSFDADQFLSDVMLDKRLPYLDSCSDLLGNTNILNQQMNNSNMKVMPPLNQEQLISNTNNEMINVEKNSNLEVSGSSSNVNIMNAATDFNGRLACNETIDVDDPQLAEKVKSMGFVKIGSESSDHDYINYGGPLLVGKYEQPHNNESPEMSPSRQVSMGAHNENPMIPVSNHSSLVNNMTEQYNSLPYNFIDTQDFMNKMMGNVMQHHQTSIADTSGQFENTMTFTNDNLLSSTRIDDSNATDFTINSFPLSDLALCDIEDFYPSESISPDKMIVNPLKTLHTIPKNVAMEVPQKVTVKVNEYEYASTDNLFKDETFTCPGTPKLNTSDSLIEYAKRMKEKELKKEKVRTKAEKKLMEWADAFPIRRNTRTPVSAPRISSKKKDDKGQGSSSSDDSNETSPDNNQKGLNWKYQNEKPLPKLPPEMSISKQAFIENILSANLESQEELEMKPDKLAKLIFATFDDTDLLNVDAPNILESPTRVTVKINKHEFASTDDLYTAFTKAKDRAKKIERDKPKPVGKKLEFSVSKKADASSSLNVNESRQSSRPDQTVSENMPQLDQKDTSLEKDIQKKDVKNVIKENLQGKINDNEQTKPKTEEHMKVVQKEKKFKEEYKLQKIDDSKEIEKKRERSRSNEKKESRSLDSSRENTQRNVSDSREKPGLISTAMPIQKYQSEIQKWRPETSSQHNHQKSKSSSSSQYSSSKPPSNTSQRDQRDNTRSESRSNIRSSSTYLRKEDNLKPIDKSNYNSNKNYYPSTSSNYQQQPYYQRQQDFWKYDRPPSRNEQRKPSYNRPERPGNPDSSSKTNPRNPQSNEKMYWDHKNNLNRIHQSRSERVPGNDYLKQNDQRNNTSYNRIPQSRSERNSMETHQYSQLDSAMFSRNKYDEIKRRSYEKSLRNQMNNTHERYYQLSRQSGGSKVQERPSKRKSPSMERSDSAKIRKFEDERKEVSNQRKRTNSPVEEPSRKRQKDYDEIFSKLREEGNINKNFKLKFSNSNNGSSSQSSNDNWFEKLPEHVFLKEARYVTFGSVIQRSSDKHS